MLHILEDMEMSYHNRIIALLIVWLHAVYIHALFILFCDSKFS